MDQVPGVLSRESMVDTRDSQTGSWIIVEGLSSPSLRPSLGDGNVQTVLDPGDDRLGRLI